MPPSFTTPPLTRKRKAAEAALADDNQPLTRAATQAQAQVPARNATASDTRSRKKPSLAVSNTQSNPSASLSTETEGDSSASSESQKKRDPATPATTTASMDSDDEMLSDVSSQDDFLDAQISEDESLGEGMWMFLGLLR